MIERSPTEYDTFKGSDRSPRDNRRLSLRRLWPLLQTHFPNIVNGSLRSRLNRRKTKSVIRLLTVRQLAIAMPTVNFLALHANLLSYAIAP
jgi:hypothetical protein